MILDLALGAPIPAAGRTMAQEPPGELAESEGARRLVEAETILAGAAHRFAREFLHSLGTLVWHARVSIRRVPAGEEWERNAPTFASVLISWRNLQALATEEAWPRVMDRLRRAYTPEAPPLKVGKLRAVRTVTELVNDELGWLVRNLVFIDRKDPEPRDGDLYLQFAKAWEGQGRTRAVHALEVLSSDALDCDDLAVRLSTEFHTAYPIAAPTSGPASARLPRAEAPSRTPRTYRPDAPRGWIYMTDFCVKYAVNPKTAHYHKSNLQSVEFRVEPESKEVLVREAALLGRIKKRGRPERRSKI